MDISLLDGGRGLDRFLCPDGILSIAVLIVDTLLIGGFKFIFSKIAEAVDAELNDDSVLREELLAAQMRVELGEMTQEEFAELEREILKRIREIRDRNTVGTPSARDLKDMKVTGIEATMWTDEDDGGASRS